MRRGLGVDRLGHGGAGVVDEAGGVRGCGPGSPQGDPEQQRDREGRSEGRGEDPDGHACRVEARYRMRSATKAAASTTVAAARSRSAASDALHERFARERLARPVGEDERALDRHRLAAEPPRAVGQATLREGEERRPGRGKHRLDPYRPRLRDEAGERGERSPREREPEVGVCPAAEELEVVDGYERDAQRRPGGGSTSVRSRATPTPMAAATTTEATASPTRTGDGIVVPRDGRGARRARARRLPSRARTRATVRQRSASRPSPRGTRRRRRTRGASPCTEGGAA